MILYQSIGHMDSVFVTLLLPKYIALFASTFRFFSLFPSNSWLSHKHSALVLVFFCTITSIYRDFWKAKNVVNFKCSHLQKRKMCIEIAVTLNHSLC